MRFSFCSFARDSLGFRRRPDLVAVSAMDQPLAAAEQGKERTIEICVQNDGFSIETKEEISHLIAIVGE